MTWNRAVRSRAVLASFALAALLPACHKWVSLDASPTQAIREEPSATLRLTLADSSRVVLEAPRVRGDSLIVTGGGGFNSQ